MYIFIFFFILVTNDINITLSNHQAYFYKPYLFQWIELLLNYVLISEIPNPEPQPVNTTINLIDSSIKLLLNEENYDLYYNIKVKGKHDKAIELVTFGIENDFKLNLTDIEIKYKKYLLSQEILNIPFAKISSLKVIGSINDINMKYKIKIKNPIISLTPLLYTTFLSLFSNNFSVPYGKALTDPNMPKMSIELELLFKNSIISLGSGGYTSGRVIEPLLGQSNNIKMILNSDGNSGDMSFKFYISNMNFKCNKNITCINVDDGSTIYIDYITYNNWIDRKMNIIIQDGNILLLNDVFTHIYQFIKEYLYITRIANPPYSKSVIQFKFEHFNLFYRSPSYGGIGIVTDLNLLLELTNVSNIYHGVLSNTHLYSLPEYGLGLKKEIAQIEDKLLLDVDYTNIDIHSSIRINTFKMNIDYQDLLLFINCYHHLTTMSSSPVYIYIIIYIYIAKCSGTSGCLSRCIY